MPDLISTIWGLPYMSSTVLECGEFARALFTSADHLNINLDILDNLNVFPVPDGDTGANMAATFIPAVKKLENAAFSSCYQIGEIILPGMDNHSRGNSGFIISRFFKGFFSGMTDVHLTVERLKEGFSRGYYEAHTSLFNPVEGTMISVISSMAESISRWENTSVHECLEEAVLRARETLFRTPKMLPVLARAGVVDSGALGFICIIEGFLLGLRESEPFRENEDHYRFKPDPKAEGADDSVGSGQFCTELSMKLDHPFPEEEIREYLVQMGSSIALVREDDLVKLHIHTDFPEQVINKFEQYGNLTDRKIDDIYAQIKGGTGSGEAFQGCEVLPCVPGEGFGKIFNELGVENVLVYGSSLPSVMDIMNAVEKAGVNDIILLPNDANILPACMTVKEKSSRHISILPTGNVVQGLTAYYGFSENEDLPTNIASMGDCMDMAEAFFLHQANADRSFGGVDIGENDFFIVKGKEILSVDKSFSKTVVDALTKIDLSEKGNVTFFSRDDSFGSELEKLTEKLKTMYPHLEIEILNGGQARGDLIISIE